MSHYRYLSIEEREKLCLTRGLGAKLCEIAQELGRAVSTISQGTEKISGTAPYSPSQV